MKKGGQIAVIVMVVFIMLSGAITFLLMGVRAGDKHYVCIEINPRVEFLTNRDKEVTSFKPLNEEAKTLLIDEEIVGLPVTEATVKFVDLCARAGYIDVNGKDNAVKISVLSGLNQALEVKLYRAVSKYFTNNEIFGAVFDGSKDLNMYKTAKKQGVSSEKYDLMLAVAENNNGIDIKSLKNKSNKELIDIIEEQHKMYKFEYTDEELANKVKLIDFNRTNYDNHKENITESSIKKFREKYAKYLKTDAKKYEQNFDKTYQIWLENK